ncbi:hypothetical protein [Mesorhizobium sp. M1027]|uniref:hypothetical protein n=1 Tax=Mesorhizobium sp. M1027 TaxID=2957050 RepID=UPI00333D4226
MAYHDSLTTGRELNTHRAAAKAPTFESDGRALAGLGANDGINHVVIAWDGSRVSGEGGRIFSVFSLPDPTRVATERPLGVVNPDNAHIRTRWSL